MHQTEGLLRGSVTNCTSTAPGPKINCTMTAKTALYPPCPVTAFWPRVLGIPGPCPDAASGNMPTRQAGSFAKIAFKAIS